jgi:hypothetical protein
MTKIVILSHKKVANCYAANLMSRRHEITISGGGAIRAPVPSRRIGPRASPPRPGYR